MERLKRLKETLLEKTGSASMLEVYGVSELLLTGCRSLLDFDDKRVVCDTVNGRITVNGRGLCVTIFRGDLLSVSGTLASIDFSEGDVC